MTTSRTRVIEVDTLARVEGEGALTLRVRGEQLLGVEFRIFEPPRFFEAFLRGRDFREVPDITARICGICPIAYMMGASQALEDVCGVTVDGPLRALRRLIYCGEWIESHVLHMFLLHLPDFLGVPDAVALAATHREAVTQALRVKKLGNEIMRAVGGREIHPVNLQLGGFYRAPERSRLAALLPEIEWSEAALRHLLDVLAALHFPAFEVDYEFMALRHPDEYAIDRGEQLVTSTGIVAPLSGYDALLTENHVRHSTALQSRRADTGTPVHLGPLARVNLNRAQLPAQLRALAEALGLPPDCRNPFKAILARGIEVLYALGEARRLIEAYREPAAPAVTVEPRAGTGFGATEAPRGICYHRYAIDAGGQVLDAKIVAPTSVNQRQIEADLYRFAATRLALPDAELRHDCEQLIRNYDPCISCSTHFLDLRIEREPG